MTPPDLKGPRFETFGCRLNAYETEAMKDLTQGLDNTIIINTCAVTAEAVRQARQRIRKLRRENPGAEIIVTGCAAQTETETFQNMPEVNRIIGNIEKMQVSTWDLLRTSDTEKIQVNDIMSATETAGHLIDGFGTRARAYVQVQNGCDHRCTFCIIPFGRGNSRSVPAGVVVEQIKRLVGNGYNEVVLTGVDMTSWGADLPREPKLGDLVQRILKLVPDLPRGFPTETDAMFENSLKLVEECDLTWLHIFPYSIREGTPAAKMPQVEKAEIKARNGV